jgi:cytochrome c oxidase subunit 2
MLVVGAAAGFSQAACSRGALNPQTSQAKDIADLWWLMLALSIFVCVAVLGLLGFALFRRRSKQSGFERKPRNLLWFILGGGAAIPAVILLVVFAATISVMAAKASGTEQPLRIDIVGHDWWWEVSYPDAGITTANEIHVPTGAVVDFHVRTADVIHSFYIPELGRKIDLIPGVENTMQVKVLSSGTWRGQCAEYCGLQHAHMAIFLTAQDRSQFDSWLTDQKRPLSQPLTGDALKGEQVFLGSACVYCHTVQGTNATGKIGPDLTHLMSRDYLASGTVPNTPGNLAGWVLNPQTIKPGNQMPATQLSGPEVQSLLTYLQGLK